MFRVDQVLPLFILLPLLGGFLTALIARHKKIFADLIFFITISMMLFICTDLFVYMSKPETVVYCIGNWSIIESITFVLDGLSIFLLAGVYVVSFCVMLYSLKFQSDPHRQWKLYNLILLLLTGINGVILAGDLFTMYLFVELASVCSYALVCFSQQDQSMAASFKFMIKGVLASALILLAISICYSYTATLSLADISLQLYARQVNTLDPAMIFVVVFIQVLFFIGFLIKSGIIPANSWAPSSQRYAQSPVSAILAAIVMPVVGIYPLIRIFFNVIGTDQQSLIVIRAVGVLSIIGGLLWAVKKNNLKTVIGFHAMSEYGFVVLGMGIFSPLGILGALFHLINTQLALSLAFANAGIMEYIFGRERAEKAGLSFINNPLACITTVLGNLALIGIAPFAGFWSKLIIIFAAWQAGYKMYAFCGIAAIGLSAVSLIKQQKQLFAKGKNNFNMMPLRKPGTVMLLSLVIMSVLCLGLNLLLLEKGKKRILTPAMNIILNATDYSRRVLESKR
jgi:multicomponent Na+:H+ antiporter subunit D